MSSNTTTGLSTLSGAALTNASLAAIGGGSLAVVRAGKAGGTLVISSTEGAVAAYSPDDDKGK